MTEMQRDLDSWKINIVQIPLDYYPFALPPPASTSTHQPGSFKKEDPPPKRTSFAVAPSEAFLPSHNRGRIATPDSQAKRGTSFAVGLVTGSEEGSTRYLHKMENGGEIVMKLENDAIQLKILLASPHIGSQKQKGNTMLDTVCRLKELVSLLAECQNQVAITLFLPHPITRARARARASARARGC